MWKNLQTIVIRFSSAFFYSYEEILNYTVSDYNCIVIDKRWKVIITNFIFWLLGGCRLQPSQVKINFKKRHYVSRLTFSVNLMTYISINCSSLRLVKKCSKPNFIRTVKNGTDFNHDSVHIYFYISQYSCLTSYPI